MSDEQKPVVTYTVGGGVVLDPAQMVTNQYYPIWYNGNRCLAIKHTDGSIGIYKAVPAPPLSGDLKEIFDEEVDQPGELISPTYKGRRL